MITGGSSGIGFAIAERFLQEGAERVILVGRSFDRLFNAAERLLQGLSTSTSASKGKEGPVGSGGNDDIVATRSPEEDNEERSVQGGGHATLSLRQDLSPGSSLVAASDNISLLVGDVSSAGQWNRELEKEMVFTSFSNCPIFTITFAFSPSGKDIRRTLRKETL
jgi:NAD(P)-dependent dehydrogenase (short-subunit alcohol dehydrogenase family)